MKYLLIAKLEISRQNLGVVQIISFIIKQLLSGMIRKLIVQESDFIPGSFSAEPGTQFLGNTPLFYRFSGVNAT